MQIQFNTRHNIQASEEDTVMLNDLITKKLKRFSHQISRLEVHLKDENSSKKGLNDKRCLLEARIDGLQPIAVTYNSDTNDQAVIGAITKLKTSLDTIIGKLSNKH